MASLAEVAQAAGVSSATASRVLNGQGRSHRISEATVERVRQAAHQLGYSPSYHARALRTQRSWTIGVVMDAYSVAGETQPWTSGILGGIDLQVRSAHCNVLLLGDRSGNSMLAEAASALVEGRVDALIVMDYVLDRSRAAGELHHLPDSDDVPIAVIGPAGFIGDAGNTGHVGVEFAVEPGLDAAIEHVHKLGHRRIVWIGPTHDEVRLPHVRRVAKQRGLALEVLQVGPENPEDTDVARLDMARACMAAADIGKATAVLCWNDLMAIGTIAALNAKGLRVPEDISVMGVDDLVAQLVVPPLSTVHLPVHEMGRMAAELALAMAADHGCIAGLRGTTKSLPASFVARLSTAAVRPTA
jgi:DNA-binding LacI/PurR family transcriptional regulator